MRKLYIEDFYCVYNVYITFIYSSVVISNMVMPFDLPKGGAVRTPLRCIELFDTGHLHQRLIKAEKFNLCTGSFIMNPVLMSYPTK